MQIRTREHKKFVTKGEDGQANLNFDDEIIAGACITREEAAA